MLSQIIEVDRDLAQHLVAHRARYRDSAARSECLQSSRHVHAVAVDVLTLDDDFAQRDADAIADAIGLRRAMIRLGRLLDFVSTVDRRNDAPELDQCTVPHQLDHACAATHGSKMDFRFVLSRSSVAASSRSMSVL